jgi:hypothetical protein
LFLLTKSSKINSEKIHFCVWNYGISIFKWFYIACYNANFVLKYLYCETWLNWTPNKTEFSMNRNLNKVSCSFNLYSTERDIPWVITARDIIFNPLDISSRT